MVLTNHVTAVVVAAESMKVGKSARSERYPMLWQAGTKVSGGAMSTQRKYTRYAQNAVAGKLQNAVTVVVRQPNREVAGKCAVRRRQNA